MILDTFINVKPLIGWNEPNGEGCIASDMINDQDIIPYLNLPVGTHLIRTDNGKFIEDDGRAIVFEKQ